MSYKIDTFQDEIEYVQNPKYKEFMKNAIEILPDYFFKTAASSSGKYHPTYALGEGGLVRHTKAAVRIALELFRLESLKYTDDEKDIIIVSLILHDGFKSGVSESKYHLASHPVIAKEQILKNTDLCSKLDEKSLHLICDNIERHMGAWNKDYKTGKEIMPKPSTKMQNFVHLADYIASRKCLEFNFDVDISR